MTMPTLQQAQDIFEQVSRQTDEKNIIIGMPAQASRKHALRVAQNAREIAARTAYLNPEKAYIMGLLHDCGEPEEFANRANFHGTAGYDKMMALGFDEVARTCLSHSFFEDDISSQNYPAYPADCIIRAAQLLAVRPFDDYDHLIHLSDLMVKVWTNVRIEDRLDYVADKYHVPAAEIELKKAKSARLKAHIDELCGTDVYQLLGIS